MIKDIKIYQIYNSRKEKILKVVMKTGNGTFFANAPAGASRGKYEARTTSNMAAIREFAKIAHNFKDVKDVDRLSAKLPANISTPLSIAAWKSYAKYSNSFPYPLGNVIGGGLHGGVTGIQEFLVCPVKAKSVKEAVETNKKIHKAIGKVLHSRKNYEGAWKSRHDEFITLDVLCKVAEHYGAKVGLDVAASSIFKRNRYYYSFGSIRKEEQIDFMRDLIRTYKLFYVEDPFHEDDFRSFQKLKSMTRCLIVGDDLTVTNPKRLERAKVSINGIIIKVNQIGTVSKALQTIKLARKYKIKPIISHRSGETLDPFIADFAVFARAPLIKCGIYGKEREAKTDRLIKLWRTTIFPKMAKI